MYRLRVVLHGSRRATNMTFGDFNKAMNAFNKEVEAGDADVLLVYEEALESRIIARS